MTNFLHIKKPSKGTYTMNPIIQVSDVSFSYPKSAIVFKNVSFDVNPGEIIGIVGQFRFWKNYIMLSIKRDYPSFLFWKTSRFNNGGWI